MEHEIAADKVHLAAIEALDPAGLSGAARFERDLELHNVRLGLFESDEVRRWERRSSGASELGDAVFLLFARGSAPLAERLERIADRLGRRARLSSRSTAPAPSARRWACGRPSSGGSRSDLPGLFAEVRAAADGVLPAAGLARLDRAVADASGSARGARRLDRDHPRVGRRPTGPLGREAYDELVGLRAFGDLDADAILEIG